MLCGFLFCETGRLLLNAESGHFPPGFPETHMYNVFARPWKEPLKRCCAEIINEYPIALAQGDMIFAGWSVTTYILYFCEAGNCLEETLCVLNHWLPLLEATGQSHFVVMLQNTYLLSCRELHGGINSVWRDQRNCHSDILKNRIFLCYYLACSGKMAFLFGEHDTARSVLSQAKILFLEDGGSMNLLPYTVIYESLAILALLPANDALERRRMLQTVTKNRQQLEIWTKHNPANFLHLERLVAAAWQRAMGHPEKAVPLCEEAVESIRAQSGEIWMQYEAMALELAGECLLDLHWNSLARHVLHRAVRAWFRYGADALVKRMERRHGPLVQGWNREEKKELPAVSDIYTSDRQSSTVLIDYPSLLQASQAIASEISYVGVTGRLLSLALANAGAERARLFLPRNGDWTQACAEDGEVISQCGNSADENTHERLLPLVRYVARSREPLVLGDAATDPQWSNLSGDSCSLLCTPLLHTGDVMGVLLLEHTSSKGVFTRERVETVAILGAQATISLTNARVMEELQQHLLKIRQLGAHLDRASETEKRRLAGEVHDELGNTLTTAKISLFMLGKRQRDEADRQRCQEIYQLTDQALRSVRRISHALRPDVLDRMGLRVALADLAGSTQTHSGLDCQLDTEEREWPLDETQCTALFRIAQEALTNVVRHAKAKKVVITLRKEEEAIVLEINDDGCGIPAERAQNVGSFGVVGMQERAERLGGSVNVAALATGGTRVMARIPLSAEGGR